MQTQLPFFPCAVLLINPFVGIYKKDDFVYYLHNGSPLFCHYIDDRKSYRYITANLVVNNLCTPSELSRALGVHTRSIQIYAKLLRDKGAGWFFNRQETRGECYKVTEAIISEAQQMLDKGMSKRSIGKQLGISDSAIRYHLKSGKFKKTK